MRKFQQQLLLGMVRTFEQEQAKGAYSDCKKAACFVDETICKAVDGGTQTSALLDEYCELIDKTINGEIGKKALSKHLIKIENSIRSEFKPDRIEAVFFPYHPAKWDSLESVYLAAKDDPQCDVYVVPIPYYELNPDETFGELRYCGDKFPDSVPIVNWEDYDVEERHPDIIFTHYAYDDNTSNYNIHPNFYGKNLKGCCELLVHIPYFVELEHAITEYYGHLPGIMYADYVTVQSEKVRQEYIKQYNGYVKEYKLEGIYSKPKDKFIVFGSPKIDKVINSNKEGSALPDEWQKLIFRPDGSKRQIILYNTHMWEWIYGGGKYTDKIRSVFNELRGFDDAVLWWRPHPNTEVNFKTKRPEMLPRYYETVDEYLSSGFGIYDDTMDLHRAISWSDVYYGDWSSLVALCQFIGKPVMIQNLDTGINGEKHPMFATVYDDGQFLWFAERNINALFKMDKQSLAPEFAGELPTGGDSFLPSQTPLYHRPAAVNDTIYFPPMYAKEICAYSISDGTFRTIPYHDADGTYTQRAFSNAICHNEYIFFTPGEYPAILRLNTLTDEIEYCADWLPALKKMMTGGEYIFSANPTVVGKSIMLLAYNANAVIEFDMNTLSSTIHTVGRQGYRYNGICFDGSCYWLSCRHNALVVRWDKETGDVSEYNALDDDDERKLPPFRPIICCGGYVWLIPNAAKKAIKINTHTCEVSEAEQFSPDSQEMTDNEITHYHCAFTSGDSVFAYNAKNGCMIVYNCKSGEKRAASICYSSEVMEHMQPLIDKAITIDSEAFCHESNIIGIPELAKCLANPKNSEKNSAAAKRRADMALQDYVSKDGTAGAKIYNHFKSEILGGGTEQ